MEMERMSIMQEMHWSESDWDRMTPTQASKWRAYFRATQRMQQQEAKRQARIASLQKKLRG
jgi:hypothetical protein